jgi:pyruvate dehydrogenase E2 component (dihydrolipoamide acetyltransferase)
VNLEERVALTPTRKAIAKAMVNSKHTAPHVTLHDEVEVTNFGITVRNLKKLLLKMAQNLLSYHMLLKH